ncbi:MAG: hypothetical protein JNJ46_19910 [Myxococcales bacterium]|nr:hypothetical protein [Myxococcales bacterium]
MAEPFSIASIPSGVHEPGVYITLRTDGDPGLSAPNNRCLILGYLASGGTATADQPIRVLSQDQADVEFRSYSMLAHAYAAAKRQVPVGCEIWCVPLQEPSSGTAQVVNVEIVGEPSAGVVSAATTAAAADTMRIKYRGRGIAVSFKAGDAFTDIALAAKTAWDQFDNMPAVCGRSGAALTFTARHKGAFDDGAVEVSFDSKGASGVAAKLGTITFSGTAGTTGSATLMMNAKSAQITITSGDAETVSSTGLVNKLLTGSYPVRAAQPGTPTGVVTLYYANGRPVRPLGVSIALTSVTVQTATASVGTAGAGVPTLTAALTALGSSDDAYKAWSLFYTSTSELSATATHIETESGVAEGMKGQHAIFCLTNSAAAMATANIPTATTPRLDSSRRYPILWAMSAANAGWELAARYAAEIAAENYVARNFNGMQFIGDDSAPVVPIHPLDRPTRGERNDAIGLRHSPVSVDSSGNMAVIWAGTSYKPKGFKDAKLVKLSASLTLDYYNYDLNNTLDVQFRGKKLKANSPARTANSVTTRSLEEAVYRWARRLDDADLFDGAEAKRDAIKAAIVVSPTRVDVTAIFAPLADLDIIAVSAILE